MKRVQMWCPPSFKKFAKKFQLDNNFPTLEVALSELPKKLEEKKNKNDFWGKI